MEARHRILVVDDEAPIRDVLERMLEGMDLEVVTAADGDMALSLLDVSIDVILLDVTMGSMDGLEVVRRIRDGSVCPDVPICMVTGTAGKSNRLEAVEAGASDFIAKPVDRTELRVRVGALLQTKRAQDELKQYHAYLERMVAERTASLRQSLAETIAAEEQAQQAQLETIERLALAAELRDEDTAMHLKRMSHYVRLIAQAIGLPEPRADLLLHASPMHDVGKIGIPDAVLLKPGKLDEDEWHIMKTHTQIGARVLAGSSSELLQLGEEIALSHHEKWDGSGYPRGLAGESIPLSGRICAVADVFDALTSQRPYKRAFSVEESVQIMRDGRARHFDPELLDAFLRDLGAVNAIRDRFRDAG